MGIFKFMFNLGLILLVCALAYLAWVIMLVIGFGWTLLILFFGLGVFIMYQMAKGEDQHG